MSFAIVFAALTLAVDVLVDRDVLGVRVIGSSIANVTISKSSAREEQTSTGLHSREAVSAGSVC